jgi:hypothetical protein
VQIIAEGVFLREGVGIFIRQDLRFTNINLDTFCNDQDIEACGIKLDFMDLHLYILGIYRVPAGNFNKILT